MPRKKELSLAVFRKHGLGFLAPNVCWFRRRVLAWYRDHGKTYPWRNNSASLYDKIISEVLLQRTRAETVDRFFPSFIRQFTSWKKLSRAKIKELQVCLKPIGLWRRRASSIEKLAAEMARRRGRFPRSREAIEKLPGVGQYIANAIMMFAQGKALPLLDTNMARVLERFFGPRKLSDIRYDPYLQALSKAVVSGKDPAKINWAILDLAATTCTIRNPRHDNCPFKKKCKYRKAKR